ncbi:zinc finger protein 791-like isoform X3 [Leguminivora glycinivorella]|uniref:zinc finger protein 791-like isoform X2 n=1 Tax=Leguminivora glycinivorella TaxID=1035111 RepID=UPI00200EC8B6|nr:zinc finger protein 791-like isoform X2 [Leguminivora glycinivorella]XP_048002667.1 zinc finger protein 791-like isoform X3 [Leguminivora glycinivorella]
MSSAKKSVGKRPAKRKSVVNCCRACLATDVKLVHMLEHKLDEEFFRVTGIVVVEKDMLPLHLCVWCAAFLRSCAAFRSKCVRVNELILPLQGKLTIDSVRAMDRFANQLVNLTLTDIEVEGTDEKSSVPLDLKPIAMNNEKKELFVDIQSSYENEIKIHVKDEIKKTDLDNDEYHETFEDGFENTVFIEAKLENVSDKIHDTTQSVDTCMGIKGQKEVCYARRKRRKKPHLSRSAENDFLPAVDVEELKKTWNVDVEILTHEQQLAEIAERRDSAEYRQAQYPCEPCGRYFQVEKAYRNHMLKHDRKGQHKCPVCTIRFSLQCRMWRHLDTHRFKYVCRECGFVSRTRQQAVLHHSYHEGKMYTCQYCRKQFRKLSTYLGHVRRRHKTMHIACEMCGETFINNKGLSYHKACEHGVSLKKYRECKICSVTFVSEDALKKHQETGAQKDHALLSPCAQCGDNFDTADALKEHVDGEHPSCEECNTTFVDAESYDVHIERKHYGDPQAAWRKEANLHTMALGQEPPFRFRCRNPVKKEKKYTSCCEHCGKAFTNIGLLRLHLRKHTGETPYACEHCPKRFVTKQRIAAHMPVHTGEKPFKCEQCGAAFTNKCNLHRHVRNVHLGIRKNSVCDICGRVFSTKFAMIMHVRTVHNGEPWPKRAPRKKQTTIKHAQDEDINVYP